MFYQFINLAKVLIDQEYLIQLDGEQAETRDSSENPLVRGAIAALLVGGVMGFAWMIWSIFFAARPIAKTAFTPKSTPTVFAESESDEAARLKAELALRNQASRTEGQAQTPSPSVPKHSAPTNIRKPAPVPQVRVVKEPLPPRIIQERVLVQPPQPRITMSSNKPLRVYASSPTPNPVETIDPFEQWNKLATLGQQRVASNNIKPENQPLGQGQALPNNTDATTVADNTIAHSPSATFTSTAKVPKQSLGAEVATSIPVVAVSGDVFREDSGRLRTQPNSAGEQILTSGEWGILNRTPASFKHPNFKQTVATSLVSPLRVQIGTSARAKVLVPMIWTEDDKNQGHFAVELLQDVLSTDNRVALPKGTILITEVDSVSKANKLVKQSVVAIVYTDSSGQVRQQTIPKDAILIRGEDSRPLVAKSIEDRSAAIAQQDLLIGLLGAAGRLGAVFNQNQTQSSTVISNGGFSNQTITTTARQPNVLAAAVEGFFKPMQERLSKRADKASDELERRSNGAIVPAETKVSIFFNSFFEISR
ncbi:MAG: hypothetical protein KME28_26750 [Pelatocladus maniniholoensis HA4357-MV3]|uniref:Uncharacterized protein n=1 Tax=Pelatocladus maniniholoensis HA4357-MV3 TaxID=1117104 RepID=A0A9E3HCW6_9NOST|nr:hypothetical protein [Pelatocladus maniniholoensis HA4357-MV3]